ncbi:uncharacterized protein LOC125932829 isoform X1 [Panthera uncia]|uniref:uncharacterized protein LOC125932829 isoform X1 n=1 Tax=Panthera uncia TaxID=29064 RepID=UPI0020FFB456|nr:uncharacterized protein LOC125932829 isoform X1 [Panthera uncia]
MSEGYTLKLETRILGAVQIMNGLFYCALGFLCFALFVEEENREATGYIPVIVTLTYVFCSSTFSVHWWSSQDCRSENRFLLRIQGYVRSRECHWDWESLGDRQQEWGFTNACFYPQFITSGSISIQAQKHPTKCKLIASMVMNILSACFSVLGIMILSIASLTYYPDTNEYLWSHIAGSMLLQYVLFTTIVEVICAYVTVKRIEAAMRPVECSEISP